MAVLMFRNVRVHPEATMKYITNPEKVVPGDNGDVWRVMDYMGNGGPDRVYSIGHNCSPNPALCAQEFALQREQYYAFKGGSGVQGVTGDKQEVLAMHFFWSYEQDDPVTPEMMDEITTRFFNETKIKHFSALAANHFNTDHKHTHAVVNQYSATLDTPHKFAMKRKDFADMRRTLNHICYEYGLSIIDLPELRKDPEYSRWLDDVIVEGKVRVLEANESGYKYSHDGKGSYYRWLQAVGRIREEEERLEAANAKAKSKADYAARCKAARERSAAARYIERMEMYNRDNLYRNWIWTETVDVNFFGALYLLTHIMLYGDLDKYFEMHCPWVLSEKDQRFSEEMEELGQDVKEWARRNRDIVSEWNDPTQSVETVLFNLAFDFHADTLPELQDRISSVGEKMNELKMEIARHNTIVNSMTPLHDAILAYEQFRSEVEGVENPSEQAREIYNAAYNVMAAHQCTTDEQREEFMRRYLFHVKKTRTLPPRLLDAKRQYRDAKRLEALAKRWEDHCAEERGEHLPLDAVISASEKQRDMTILADGYDRGNFVRPKEKF